MKASLSWLSAPKAPGQAALFGDPTPLSKLLLGHGVDRWRLAGLLCLGWVAASVWFTTTHGLLGMPPPPRRGVATFRGSRLWCCRAVYSALAVQRRPRVEDQHAAPEIHDGQSERPSRSRISSRTN